MSKSGVSAYQLKLTSSDIILHFQLSGETLRNLPKIIENTLEIERSELSMRVLH